jgi:dihydrofolate synthase/folylpolyglutamate synthase
MTVPRSLDGWLDYISAQHPDTIALGLERVAEVAARLRLARPPFVITVGGTNGKGSTCAYLERILLEASYRVGLYTSPHLLRYNERVRVGGAEATDAGLCEAFARVEAARGATPLTYFEFGTLAALDLFGRAGLDALVLEVGLGGRLDAVNIVDADCAIVSGVDLDHQALLGDTREEIAFEKAGIFRAGRPAFYGDTDPPAALVGHARDIGAELQVLGRDFGFSRTANQWQFHGREGRRHALPIPALRGAWQLKNAATVLAALGALRDRLPVALAEVKQGLTRVQLPGRMQVLPGRPVTVLDVAHNPQAARALADGLLEMGFHENTLGILAMLADKDIAGVVGAMAGRIDRWLVAPLPGPRGAGAGRLAEVLSAIGQGERTRQFASVASALATARREAGPNDRIVIFGSFLTVAEALKAPH